MKKQPRKMVLSKETLRQLEESQMEQPAGGILQRPTQSCNAASGCLTCAPCHLT